MKQYNKLYCGLNELDAHENYNLRKLDYGNGKVEYYIYNYEISRLKKGVEIRKTENKHFNEHWLVNDIENEKLEQIKNNAKKKETVKDVKETVPNKEISKQNLLKSSRRLYQYANANASEFKSFITLTFEENIEDLNIANKKFNIWRTNIKNECKKLGIEFKYLGVPEFQKRGAVHYHILTNIPVNNQIIPKREKKELYNPSSKKTRILEYYDLKFWSYGYSSAFDLTLTNEKFDIVKYIAKYFFKDMDNRFYSHNKILKSNNLNKAIETVEKIDKDMWDIVVDKVKDINDEVENMYIYENMVILKMNELPF